MLKMKSKKKNTPIYVNIENKGLILKNKERKIIS